MSSERVQMGSSLQIHSNQTFPCRICIVEWAGSSNSDYKRTEMSDSSSEHSSSSNHKILKPDSEIIFIKHFTVHPYNSNPRRNP